MELTVNFPGSRYTLKFPFGSLLNVVACPLVSFAVNVPLTIGFSSAPKMRPETISAAAAKGSKIKTPVAKHKFLKIHRIFDILRQITAAALYERR